jgi:uncharacterized phage-associated protein
VSACAALVFRSHGPRHHPPRPRTEAVLHPPQSAGDSALPRGYDLIMSIMANPPRLARWPFRFDPDKAVEALLFVAGRIPDPTLHSLSKVFFHADKMHLSRYGRPITGDYYVAMKHGPVPSATYDILKTIRGDARFPLPRRAHGALVVVNNHSVVPSRAADESVLSKSELECLAESAAEHGSKSFNQCTAESHGPAWTAADENDVIVLENMLLEIENRDELREHFAQEE